MAKVEISGVYRVRSKGRTYYYAWKGKGAPRLPGEPGSPEFAAALAEANRSKNAPDTDRVSGLVHSYKASPSWKEGLAETTRRVWARWLDRIVEHFGPLPTKVFDRPNIKPDIRKWRDRYRATPRAADTGMQVLSRLMSYAVEEGIISANPCVGIGHLYESDRADIIWTEDDLAELEAVASPEVMWAANLAALTGLRQDDCRRLTWSEVSDLAIERRTGKSRGRKIALIPMHADLRALLETIPKRAVQVLTNTRGLPWRSGLSDSFRDAAALAGVDKHFHDLRGTFATRAYLAGFSMREIAEMLGWEEERVERIINRYVRRDALLRDRIARLDGTRTEPGGKNSGKN